MVISNVVLIGFMGSGKSAVSMNLARLLSFKCVDSDKLVEIQSGKSIAALFSESESYFRSWEQAVIKGLSKKKNMIGFVVPCSYKDRNNIIRICKFFINKRNIKIALILNDKIECYISTKIKIIPVNVTILKSNSRNVSMKRNIGIKFFGNIFLFLLRKTVIKN